MKACTVIALSAIIAMASIDSVVGLATYLTEIPNGSNFAKSLGHTDTGYTDFGTAFSAAGATWTTTFCQATYPGASMTNGEAFGDPCCTWKKGATPDKTVTVWTDKPTVKTVCASTAAATTAPASSGSSSSSSTPATTAPASSGSSSSSSSAGSTAASSSGSSSTSPSLTPAATTATPSSSSSKGKISKCKVKEDKKSSSDGSDDDY